MNCYKNVTVIFFCKKSSFSFKSIPLLCNFIIPEKSSFSLVAESGVQYPMFLSDIPGVFTEYSDPEEFTVYMSESVFNDFLSSLKEYGFDIPSDL